MKDQNHPETRLMHLGERDQQFYGAVVPPLFQNSLYTYKDWDEISEAFDHRLDRFIYTRQKNPTTELVESKLASIAGGEKAKLFPSGMAALTAALLHFLNWGDHVIAVNNIYGPANNLLTGYLKNKLNIDTTFVSGMDLGEFEIAIKPKTRLIYLESPSSAIFTLQDLSAVADFAGSRGIKTLIDNSWATPIFQRPLGLGIDMELHSCSKYIGGHSDLVAGLLIGSAEDLDLISLNESELLGSKMAPFESWLLLRSLRTLQIRMLRHQQSAMEIARLLEAHTAVEKVRYPGLKSHLQYELGKGQMNGYSGLLSFELKTRELNSIKSFVNSFAIFQIGVSWGGHESLVYAPAISYAKEMTQEQYGKLGIGMSDIRISVGLENVLDLKRDLERALEIIQ